MSVGRIAPGSRGLLRLHGWLLMAWAALCGVATSALLLHGLQVHSMAVRYALGAAAVYGLGFVVGGWWYARWWNRRVAAADAEVPRHATADEQAAYEKSRRKADGSFDLPGSDLLGFDDPLSALIAIIGLILFAFVVLWFAGWLPVLVTDLAAGYLAEIVLEFVIGAALYRRVLKPKDIDGYWAYALRKSLLAGVLLVVVFGAAGAWLQGMQPGAVTVWEVVRGWLG